VEEETFFCVASVVSQRVRGRSGLAARASVFGPRGVGVEGLEREGARDTERDGREEITAATVVAAAERGCGEGEVCAAAAIGGASR